MILVVWTEGYKKVGEKKSESELLIRSCSVA